jgi:hypothetical protein
MNKYLDTPLTDEICNCKPLYKDVCEFFSTLNARMTGVLPEELIDFAHQGVTSLDNVDNNDVNNNDNADNDNDNDEEDGYEPVSEPYNDSFNANTSDMKYISNEDMAPYNLMAGKLINYFEVFKITSNIARTQLSVVMTKDENIVTMEEREKTKLRQELNNYMKNINIQKTFANINIDELNLRQLQYYSNQCKDLFESLKVMDVAQKGLEIFDFGYNTFCPNGIRISKTKVIKLDGATKALNEVLFDRNSTAPISFKNVIDKYNIHISDEVNTVINIARKFLKRIKIEDYEGDSSEEEEEKPEESQEVEEDEE